MSASIGPTLPSRPGPLPPAPPDRVRARPALHLEEPAAWPPQLHGRLRKVVANALTAGPALSSHVAGVMMAGIEMRHVPYRGARQELRCSFGFELQGPCSAFTSWSAHIRDPKTFPLAAHSQELVL